MKVIIVVIGICLTAVSGQTGDDVMEAASDLMESIGVIQRTIGIHTGSDFTEISTAITGISNDVITLRDEIAQFGVDAADRDRAIQDLESIIVETTQRNPQITLELFTDEPANCQSVKVKVLSNALGQLSDNMAGILFDRDDDELQNDVVQEVYALTLEIDIVLATMVECIASVETDTDTDTGAGTGTDSSSDSGDSSSGDTGDSSDSGGDTGDSSESGGVTGDSSMNDSDGTSGASGSESASGDEDDSASDDSDSSDVITTTTSADQ